MKTIKNDYLIRMFVGHDDFRPAIMKVSLQDEYLYATDYHIVAKIKSDLCVHKYVAVEKYPNAESVISEHISIEKKIVSVDTILNDLMKIEVCFKPKLIECDKCDGDGELICDCCDSTYECKLCDGTGEMPSKELELSSDENCIFFGKRYKLHYLDLIIKTAVYTEVKEIEVSNADGMKRTLFTIGDFTISLMPLSNID